MKEKKKNLIVSVSNNFHYQIKMYCLKNNTTITNVIIEHFQKLIKGKSK